MSDAQVDASRLILNDTARTIGEFDDVAASSNVVVGDVFSGILRWAEEIDADLIVVGPHRRQFRDAFIGTTAERTIAHSQRPVLMAAGVPSGPYDRALIALDLDRQSVVSGKSVSVRVVLGGRRII